MCKKKIISIMMATIMLVGIVGTDTNVLLADNSTSPVTGEGSSQDKTTVYTDGDDTTGSTYLTDKENGFTLDVTANTIGNSRDIVYSVAVVSGNYKFTYDYGMGWDPGTHSYTDTSDGGTASESGWSDDNFSDSNCKLKVTNNSNYPVNVITKFVFSSTDYFNANTSTTAVVGLFCEDLDCLKAIKAAGAGGTWASGGYTAAQTQNFNLDVVKPSDGKIWSLVSKASGNQPGDNYKELYFAFSGAPDPGKEINEADGDDTGAGTIRLDIKPVASSATYERTYAGGVEQ